MRSRCTTARWKRRRWTEGTCGLDSIRAYSAVCAGGIDTVPPPGDTSEAAIARIIGDVGDPGGQVEHAARRALAALTGNKASEMTEFNGALSNAMIQPLPGSPRK